MPARLRWIAFMLAVLTILAATLTPAEVYGPPPAGPRGFIDLRGVADAVANVLLFVPLGITGALLFGGAVPILVGTLLSAMVELLQTIVPGRFSSLPDIVFNTGGAAAGVVLVRHARLWLVPRGALRWVLPALAALGVFAVVGIGSFLFAPSVPRLVLFGQWTAEFENMERYTGEVMSAHVGGAAIASRAAPSSPDLRRSLLEGDTIRVLVRAGVPPVRPAPVFSIYDERAAEVMMLAAQGTDLIYRFRMRALDLHLDQPELRLRGALAPVDPGSVVAIEVWAADRGYCLRAADAAACGRGFTVGDTWSLLYYPVPGALEAPLRAIWLVALALPLGFWIRRRRMAAAFVIALAALLLVAPRAAGILPTPAVQIAAASAGLILGHLAGRRTARAALLHPAGR